MERPMTCMDGEGEEEGGGGGGGGRDTRVCLCQALDGSRFVFLLAEQQGYFGACVKLQTDTQLGKDCTNEC